MTRFRLTSSQAPVKFLSICLAIGTLAPAHAEPNNQPFEDYAKRVALDYLAEISERRRLNTFFENEQSPFNGVPIGYTNVRAGNLTFLNRDLVRLDRVPIVFGRVYDSRLGSGDFGPGWKLSVAERVTWSGEAFEYTDAGNSTFRLTGHGDQLRSPHPHLTGITAGHIDKDTVRLHHLGLVKTFRRHKEAFLIASVEDRHGNRLSMEYENGYIVGIASQNGRSVSIERDAAGRIIRAEDDLGRTVSYEYRSGLLVQALDLGGNEWRYRYAAGRLRSVTDPRGAESLSVRYAGAKVAQVRVQHDRFTFRYDAQSTRVTNALQQAAVFWHHPSGLTQTAQDFAGALTEIEFDQHLDARSLSFEGQRVASINYVDHVPAQLRRHDGDQPLAYDYRYENGKLRTVSLDGNGIARYRYDAQGSVIRAFDAEGDRRYRLSGDGRIESIEQDGTRIGLVPDRIGRIGAFRVNGELRASLEYDDADRVSVIRVNGESATYTYEEAGFRDIATYGDVGRIDFVYDEVGNMRQTGFDFKGRALTDRYQVGSTNQVASIDGETGDDVTFDYDRAGRVSTIYQGARHADVLRDELGRVTSLEMDDNELFSIDYSPMQIDAVIAADAKSNRVRVDSPMVSHVFGSLEHIAWARARGSVHGLIRFEPGMARFIITDEPYLAPDAATYSSLKRRSVPLRADEERFDVLAFDKPSNSLFIPPEYYSVNCTICVASVSSAEMTANGQTGPVTVTVGENVDFEVTASGSCMDWPMFPLPGTPEPIDFFHNIFYGDGGSTFKLSFFWPNTEFSHSFASPGTYNSVDNISCGCNSLLTLASGSISVSACNPGARYNFFKNAFLPRPSWATQRYDFNAQRSEDGGSFSFFFTGFGTNLTQSQRSEFQSGVDLWDVAGTSCGQYSSSGGMNWGSQVTAEILISIDDELIDVDGVLACGVTQLKTDASLESIVISAACNHRIKTSAHEVGHILGFSPGNNHSPFPNDIMHVPSVDGLVGPYHARFLVDRNAQ